MRDVAWGPIVETGASVPGYSGGAKRLSERLFGMGPDAEERIRTRRRGRQRSRAKCGNRGRRTRLQGGFAACVVVSDLDLL